MTTPRDDDGQTFDLAMLAIQEQFLEEWRAGKRPRLSVYAARYPEYATALAEIVARLEPDEQGAPPEPQQRPWEPVPEPLEERFVNGDGARRALEELFGAAPAGDQLSRVAEQPTSYDARAETPPPMQTPADPTGD